jgi:hypothetical protein
MVAGAHGNAFFVERRPDLLRPVAGEDEGQHAGLVTGRADQANAGDRLDPLRGVGKQVMLVAGDVLDADPLHIVDRRAQANGVGDVAGAGLEARRHALVEGALEGDVGDHVAATLPGRHVFENVALAVHDADAGRREDLVAGEDEEIGIDRLHIDAHVRHRLGTVDQPLAPAGGRVQRFPSPAPRCPGHWRPG